MPLRRSPHRTAGALTVVAALLAVACGDSTEPTRVARVEVAAVGGLSALTVGEEVQLQATALSASDEALDRPITFATENAVVATVNPATGLVTAVGPGTVAITATADGVSGSIELSVDPIPVATISAEPESFELHLAWTRQLAVQVKDARGNVLNDRDVFYESTDPNKASVSETGLVTANDTGTVTITVRSEGKEDTVLVHITEAPVHTLAVGPETATISDNAELQFFTILRDERGNLLSRVVTWTSTNPEAATVNDRGRAFGVAPGLTTITAAAGGMSAPATLEVRPHIDTIIVVPSAATLRVGAEAELSVTVLDEHGNALTDRDLQFFFSPPGVVALSLDDRTMRAITEGTTTLTVRAEDKATAVVITVIEPVAFVHLSPLQATVPIGSAMQLTVSVRAPNGMELTDREVTFSSENPLVASVDANGVVTAHSPGRITITATSEGVSGKSIITVPAPPQ